MTRLLIELAGRGAAAGPAAGGSGSSSEPLERLRAATSARRLPQGLGIAAAGARLEGLGELPLVCEHRDCSPWNVVLDRRRRPALLDWESAEPRGPARASTSSTSSPTAAFVLDGALEAGRTRETYAAPARPGDAVRSGGRRRDRARYSAALGLDADDLRRLRLLCWIVHSRSDYRHLELEAGRRPEPGGAAGGDVPRPDRRGAAELGGLRPSAGAGGASGRQRLAGEHLPENGERAVGAVDADPAEADRGRCRRRCGPSRW